MDNAGLTVNRVSLIKTPFTTYCLIIYDVTDALKHDNYMLYRHLRVLDQQGTPIPCGANPIRLRAYGQAGLGEGNCLICTLAISALPGAVIIGEYDGSRASGWTEGKQYTVPLQ